MDEFLTEQVTELQLDRSDWQLMKFGDVAIQQKESVDRENTDLTRYVKGEHMGSEDLHLRKWGELTDEYLGPAFIRKFEQGDILYGSRRTYLRKVAVAHFDGITSNTTFVIKANETRIDKRLLPYVMLSEGFAEHSIRNSKGSVNPYINWKDIADYEFLLPPKDQQAQLAELLWAMDDVVEKKYQFNKTIKSASEIIVSRLLIEFSVSNQIKKLGELVKITTGKLDSNAAVDGGKYPFFTCDPKTLQIDNFSFDCEALLLAGNNASGVFPLKHYNGKFDAYQRTYVITIKDTSIVCYPYLLESLKSQLDLLRKLSVGSSTKFLTMNLLMNLKTPLPTLKEQTKIVKKVEALHNVIESSILNLEISRKLLKSLINQIF